MSTRIKYKKVGVVIASKPVKNFEGKEILVEIFCLVDKTYRTVILNDLDVVGLFYTKTLATAKRKARSYLMKLNVHLDEEIRPRLK